MTCTKCSAALRQLRSIRRSVSNDVLQSLVVALMFFRLDYGSATLAGLPKQLLDRLSQLVVKTTSSLYFTAYTGFESQEGFRSGWRCLCFAVSTALHLATWRQICSASPTSTHVGDCALPVRQRLSLHGPCVLLSATVPSRRLLHLLGTVCRSQFGLRHHCQSSAVD